MCEAPSFFEPTSTLTGIQDRRPDVRPSLCSGRQKADCGYPPSKSARSLNYRTGILGSYKRIIMYKRTPDAQKIYEIQKIFKAQRILKYR